MFRWIKGSTNIKPVIIQEEDHGMIKKLEVAPITHNVVFSLFLHQNVEHNSVLLTHAVAVYLSLFGLLRMINCKYLSLLYYIIQTLVTFYNTSSNDYTIKNFKWFMAHTKVNDLTRCFKYEESYLS